MSKLEEVARAIAEALGEGLHANSPRIKAARAAIATMKPPSKAMLDAGAFHCIRDAGPAQKADIEQAAIVYTAMLNAALKEG